LLHLENSDLQEVLLLKNKSILTGQPMLDAEASNIDGFI
jgi:hypothetical protein